MKPGAVLEVCYLPKRIELINQRRCVQVIDEDLLFPGRSPPVGVAEPEGSRLGTQRRRPPSEVPPSEYRSTFTSNIQYFDIRTTASSSLLTSSPSYFEGSRNFDHSEASLLHDAIDPLDHSKLTRCWREMLTSRWISASITSVLPFYLTAIFETSRALPALEILMCSCSSLKAFPSKHGSHQQMLDPESFRHLSHVTVKHEHAHVTWLPASEAPPHFVSSNMTMHLARMVAIVNGCKEALWETYNKQYGNDPRSPYRKSRHRAEEPCKASVYRLREEFEHHWLNW